MLSDPIRPHDWIPLYPHVSGGCDAGIQNHLTRRGFQALEKAERYRLLNEPAQAECVCRDLLAVNPKNQNALVVLLLSLTDQFSSDCRRCFDHAQEVVPQLQDEYQRLYYNGLIWERQDHARAVTGEGQPGNGCIANAWIRQAMDFSARAERIRPPANEDAILRWNCCIRLCER